MKPDLKIINEVERVLDYVLINKVNYKTACVALEANYATTINRLKTWRDKGLPKRLSPKRREEMLYKLTQSCLFKGNKDKEEVAVVVIEPDMFENKSLQQIFASLKAIEKSINNLTVAIGGTNDDSSN